MYQILYFLFIANNLVLHKKFVSKEFEFFMLLANVCLKLIFCYFLQFNM